MKQIETTADLDPISYWDKLTSDPIEFNCESDLDIINSYEKFRNVIKEELNIRQFIPMDEEGNVLEEPTGYKDFEYREKWYDETRREWLEDCNKYKIAQEKILFKTKGYDLNGRFINIYLEDMILNYDTENPHFVFYSNSTIQELIPIAIPVTEALRQKLK